MTEEEAKKELASLRKQEDENAKRVQQLTAFLNSLRLDPDEEPDNKIRNNMIYQLHQRHRKMEEIAVTFKLTPAKVRQICREMDALRKKRARKQKKEK